MDAVLLGIAASADKRSKENSVAIENLKGGWRYKGAVEDYAHLPSTGNKIGDVYTTKDDGNEYAWGADDGVNQWIQIGGVVNPLTDAEVINALGAYVINTTVVNGTYSGDSAIVDTASVNITPTTGYEAPAQVTVNGVTGVSGTTGATWSYSNGVISLSNPTEDVTISASCITAIKCTVAGLGSQDPTDVSFAKDASFTKAGLGIEQVTLGTDVFIKIPTLYRKVESVSDNQITSFTISTTPGSGYEPYSCFVDESGNTLPYILIGRYWNSSSSGCVSTGTSVATMKSDVARGYATAKGTGYQLFDWQTQKLWQDLIICFKETVNTNPGGGTWDYDELGIYWTNQTGWVDGVIGENTAWHYCTKPSKYVTLSSSTPIPDDYSTVSYAKPTTTNTETKSLGYDASAPFFNYPSSAVGNYSFNTYYCDGYLGNNSKAPVTMRPGTSDASSGAFFYNMTNSWGESKAVRLCYRPLS